MDNLMAAKAVFLATLAENDMGDDIPAVLARVEELKKEYSDRINSIEDEDKRAIELAAFTMFVLDLDKMMDGINT